MSHRRCYRVYLSSSDLKFDVVHFDQTVLQITAQATSEISGVELSVGTAY